MQTLMYSYSDTKKIILEIKKRPAIYDKNHADYNNKEAREQMWTEICWEMCPNWSDLDEFERQTRFKDIQKKWRNIRDSFRKEVKFQTKQKPGKGIQKKRPYVYYKQMQFLIPFILERQLSQETSNQDQLENFSPERTEEEYEDNEDEDTSEIIKFKFENDDTQLSNSSHDSRTEIEENNKEDEQPVLEIWDDNVDNYISNDFNYSNHRDVDEDKFFLLSLIPTFKNLSPQQKLAAKVEFLQVLQRICADGSDKRTK